MFGLRCERFCFDANFIQSLFEFEADDVIKVKFFLSNVCIE